MDWWLSQPFLAPSRFPLIVVSSNKILAYLILSWHLLLVLTRLSNPNADLDSVGLGQLEVLLNRLLDATAAANVWRGQTFSVEG